MSLLEKHAVYGGVRFAEWTAPSEVGLDVTSKLQALINQNAGVLRCGNDNFGDPLPGVQKHFGAVVNRDGTDYYFACVEDQDIDFNVGGGRIGGRSPITVLFAVYGALENGNSALAEAFDVTFLLQQRLSENLDPVVCDNDAFGDPSPGSKKHFAATGLRNGKAVSFACEEGQAINFS